MREKVDIKTFHKWLHSEDEGNPLLAILSKLTEIEDPTEISAINRPQPLGSWSGWSWR